MFPIWQSTTLNNMRVVCCLWFYPSSFPPCICSPQRLVPEFDFDTYLGALMPRKLNDSESVVIYALPYYQKLTSLLKGTKKR